MAPAACEADMRPRCSRKPAIKRLSNSTEVNDCKGRQKPLSAGRDWGRIIRELLGRSGGRDVVNTSITDPTASRKFTWLRNSPKPPAGAQLQHSRFGLLCSTLSLWRVRDHVDHDHVVAEVIQFILNVVHLFRRAFLVR